MERTFTDTEKPGLVMKEIPTCPLTEEDIRIEVGHPIRKIVTIAEENNYDLVIIGTHGHGKIQDMMIGNISSGVIRSCSKPVLVVRIPVEAVAS